MEQNMSVQALMKQLGQQLALLYQQSVKCGLFRKVFHNSLLVMEVFRLPTLTPMSGCCYYSCLLRTALCLPGTFSLVQTCGQLAGSVRMCVHAVVVQAPVRLLLYCSACDVLLRMCVCVQCI